MWGTVVPTSVQNPQGIAKRNIEERYCYGNANPLKQRSEWFTNLIASLRLSVFSGGNGICMLSNVVHNFVSFRRQAII